MLLDEPSCLPPPPGDDFVSVAQGRSHACALRRSGEVSCWGRVGPRGMRPEEAGAADPPEIASPKGQFTAIAASEATTCGLRPDGELACWGPPVVPEPSGRYTSFDLHGDMLCGLGADGAVACWRKGDLSSW